MHSVRAAWHTAQATANPLKEAPACDIASSFLLRIVFMCFSIVILLLIIMFVFGTAQSYMNVCGNYCLNKHPSSFVPLFARRNDEGLLCCNCTSKRPCATGDCVKPTRVFRDPMWAQTCW